MNRFSHQTLVVMASVLLLQSYLSSAASLSTGSSRPSLSWLNNLEADISPVFRGSPDMDHSTAMYGMRFGLTNYFYNIFTSYGQFELGADASLLFLKTSQANDNQRDDGDYSKSIGILSPAFAVRWYPTRWDSVAPFIQAGIGPSYMTNNDFEGRELGNSFVFQDIFSIGLKTINPKNNNEFLFGLYVIHYSNGGLNKNNRGITLPISARLGYRF